MIPAPFEYVRAGSAEEAIALIAEHGDEAKFIAGGHSPLPLMKPAWPSRRCSSTSAGSRTCPTSGDAGDHIAIGALTRHRDVETSELLAEHVPLLKHAASHVGDPQVRHRGTIGGSIAHADSASDLPATTLALGATYVAQGPNGTREIPAGQFYQGFLESALAEDEMLTEIRVPKMQGAGWSFQKFNRRAQDWAIVGVAAWRRNGDSGVGLVNMGSIPILATSVSSALSGVVRSPTPPLRLRPRPSRRATERHRRVSDPSRQGARPPSAGGSPRAEPRPPRHRFTRAGSNDVPGAGHVRCPAPVAAGPTPWRAAPPPPPHVGA
ncbi:MAG: FAD binding domain-containing protein [Ilumatobacteraceae bacterium]